MYEATLTTAATVRFLYRGRHFVDLGYAAVGTRVAFGSRFETESMASEYRRAGHQVTVRQVRYVAD